MPPKEVERIIDIEQWRASCIECGWTNVSQARVDQVAGLAQEHTRHFGHATSVAHMQVAVFTRKVPKTKPKED